MFGFDLCIPNLSRTFIMKGCWILSKAFSSSNEMIMWGFFFFEFVYMVDYTDRFSCIKPSLHLWDEAYLIIVDELFDVILDSVCKCLIEYFFIYVHKRNWFVILFLGWVFMWFGYQDNCGLINWIEQYSFCFYLLE